MNPLAADLLRLLAACDGGTASVPRIGKQLGQPASAILREAALMGSTPVGGLPAPGWLEVQQDEGRWLLRLTTAGRAAAELAGPALPPALRQVAVQRIGPQATAAAAQDCIADEVPVALSFNGIAHAVMMATPADLEDFALGFALSEGIVDAPADCRGIDVRAQPAAGGAPAAIEVSVEIAARHFARLKERRRALAGRTGCGVCGVESLAALELAVPARVRPGWLDGLEAAHVLTAVAALAQQQPLNAQAGSLHAAGWALPDGRLVAVREDIGRHNALDKLLGHAAAQGLIAAPGFVVVSSRASYELVRKCALLGVPALAAVSAPTGLALDLARDAGLALWGWCRGDSAVAYH